MFPRRAEQAHRCSVQDMLGKHKSVALEEIIHRLFLRRVNDDYITQQSSSLATTNASKY